MPSAIPVPGQPGRLFLPGVGVASHGVNNMNSTTKTFDVQMTETELATLQGLGQLTPANPLLARKVESASSGLLKPMQDAQAAILAQQLAARAQATALAEQQAKQQAAAPSIMDKVKDALKNPMVLGGIVIAVGAVGFLLWKRSQRSVQQVAAVETLGLDGMDEKPKRKRRKSRKSKSKK